MSDDIEDTGTPKDRKFVEALARGLDVLRAFTHGSVVMGNQDIARITGLPKPTVSRMTYTLTKLGYLSYSQQLEKYQLDSGVLALGYAYVSNLRVRQLAKPYMDEFARNVMAAGVPLHLADGSIMALTCGAPSFQLSEETLKGSLAHQLEMLARDIESLGV